MLSSFESVPKHSAYHLGASYYETTLAMAVKLPPEPVLAGVRQTRAFDRGTTRT